jgi:hypothetical protein
MLSIPINRNTFSKSFLDGKGELNLQTDQDTWKTLVENGGKFTPDVATLAEIKIDVGAQPSYKFGGQAASQLKLDLDASAEAVGKVQLIWDANDKIIEKYKVKELFTPNHYFALLTFNSKADATVKGNVPLFGTPVKASLGIGGGGNLEYARLVRFLREDTAVKVVADIFGGVRLPQSVVTVDDIPDEGEVLAFGYGGYLNLSAGLTWGYSLTGTKGLKVADLQMTLDYAVRLMAAASFDYHIGGDFHIEARRSKEQNRAHIVVNKSKESTSKFAFDFGFEAKADLAGLDKTPEKLLEALLGIDTHSFMTVLDEIRSVSTVEGIETKLNDLAKKFILDRADKWLDGALNNTNVRQFLDIVNKVVKTYEEIDQKIIHLYEDFLDNKIPGLKEMLNKLIGITGRLDLSRLNADPDSAEIWNLIRRLAGDRFQEILLVDDKFKDFHDLLVKVKKFLEDDVNEHIRDFIKGIKEEFKLDDIFDEIKKFDSVDEIKNLAAGKLKELVERLVGETIDNHADVLNKILKPLQDFFAGLDNFKKKYAEAIEKAVHQSFAFNLNYAFSQVEKGDKLLDVEIDLSSPNGRALAEKALHGDFIELLQSHDPKAIKFNQVFFKDDLTRAAELKINVFGYDRRGASRLTQQTEMRVEPTTDGLLYLYMIDTKHETISESKWRENKETVKTNFSLKIAGDTIQPDGKVINPDAIQNLKNVSAQYGARYEDSKTKISELTQYLALAGRLKLTSLPEVKAIFAEKIGKKDDNDAIGKITLEYIINYSDEAVRKAFTEPAGQDFEQELRNLIREISGAKSVAKPLTDGSAVISLAYLREDVHSFYLQNNKTLPDNKMLNIPAPEWHRDAGATSQLKKPQKRVLETLYRVEDSFVKRTKKMMETLQDFPADREDLKEAADEFVELADKLMVSNRDNPFFSILDWFVSTKSNVSDHRKSALVMTIDTTVKDPTTHEDKPFKTTLYFPG